MVRFSQAVQKRRRRRITLQAEKIDRLVYVCVFTRKEIIAQRFEPCRFIRFKLRRLTLPQINYGQKREKRWTRRPTGWRSVENTSCRVSVIRADRVRSMFENRYDRNTAQHTKAEKILKIYVHTWRPVAEIRWGMALARRSSSLLISLHWPFLRTRNSWSKHRSVFFLPWPTSQCTTLSSHTNIDSCNKHIDRRTYAQHRQTNRNRLVSYV